MPTMPMRLPRRRAPSIEVGLQPLHLLARTMRSPAPMRRAVGQHQRHRHVGGVLGQHARRVGDDDAALARGVEIDVIDAGAERGDQLELRAGLAAARGCRYGRSRSAPARRRPSPPRRAGRRVSGLSSVFSRVSNSSINRVSIASGSVRVTITSGFFLEPGGMPARLAIPLVACPAGRSIAARWQKARLFKCLSSSARKYCITAANANSTVRFPLGGLCCIDDLGLCALTPPVGGARAARPPQTPSARARACRSRALHRCTRTRSTCAPGPARATRSTGCSSARCMPVEIVAEYENWRKIRDWQGASGWVHQSLLTGKRELHHSRQAGQPAQDAGHGGRGRGEARARSHGRNPLLPGRLVPGPGIQWRRQRLAGTDRALGRL